MKRMLTLICNICKSTITTIYYLPVALFVFGILDLWIMRSLPPHCAIREKWDDFMSDLMCDTSSIRSELNWQLLSVISAVVFYGTIIRVILMMYGVVE